MLFAIHAYEGIFGGLNGMEETAIIDVNTLKEAEDYAIEMSYDVMNSYLCIQEAFEEDAISEGFEEQTQEWEEFIEECRAEDVAYDVWRILDTKGKTREELEKEFHNDKENFIKKYCKDC